MTTELTRDGSADDCSTGAWQASLSGDAAAALVLPLPALLGTALLPIPAGLPSLDAASPTVEREAARKPAKGDDEDEADEEDEKDEDNEEEEEDDEEEDDEDDFDDDVDEDDEDEDDEDEDDEFGDDEDEDEEDDDYDDDEEDEDEEDSDFGGDDE